MKPDVPDLTDWKKWHESYERPESSLTRRLAVVRHRIIEALDSLPPGPIRVLSICAGDGRDLLGVLPTHPRAGDVSGRLVELDPLLSHQARLTAPTGIEVLCTDAGNSNAFTGAVPVDLLLCCGVFGNISDEDIVTTIRFWPMLCAPGAIVIWTRGAFRTGPDIRDDVRRWVVDAGFEEIAYDGPPESFGVGVARMVRPPDFYKPDTSLFSFRTRE